MKRSRFLLLFGLVLALRVGVAARFRGNFDTQSFLIVVQAVLRGQNVYAVTDRYNYSPLWSFVATGAWEAASPDAGTFVLLLGLLQIAADCGSAALVAGIGRRRLNLSPEEARRRALLFFSNPISVLISCSHGQFDGLAILFLLAAILTATGATSRARQIAIAALLSLSLLVKHIAVFHVLLFSKRRPRGVLPDGLVAAAYVLFAASFLPYASAFGSIAENVVFYAGRLSSGALQKPGGLQALVGLPRFGPAAFALVLLAAVAWTLREARGLELSRSCLMLFLALLVFSPSYAVQYLVWPVALGALFPSLAYGLFTLAGAIYHSAAPESLGLPWPVQVTPFGTWLAAAFWLGTEVVAARRSIPGRADLVAAA